MDDRISEFFDTVDMDAQHVKQTSFLTMAFGGPNSYTGKDMREAHKHMKLNEEHVNAVAECLVGTLEELNVSQGHIDEIVAIAVSVKDDVLDALLRHGHTIPNGCRYGVCQSCILVDEENTLPNKPQNGLDEQQKAPGYFYSCCTVPSSTPTSLPR